MSVSQLVYKHVKFVNLSKIVSDYLIYKHLGNFRTSRPR